MTEKELKRLNRKQLLELLLKQTERADRLQEQLDEAQKQLADRTLGVTEAGSIAEAALKLNGVFEAAEAAAAQYLENIKRMSEMRSANSEDAQEAQNNAPGEPSQSPKIHKTARQKNGDRKRCKKKKTRSPVRK